MLISYADIAAQWKNMVLTHEALRRALICCDMRVQTSPAMLFGRKRRSREGRSSPSAGKVNQLQKSEKGHDHYKNEIIEDSRVNIRKKTIHDSYSESKKPASEGEIKQLIKTIRASTLAFLQWNPLSGEIEVISALDSLCRAVMLRLLERPLPRDDEQFFNIISKSEYELWEGKFHRANGLSHKF
jgi:hypothetical protein